MGNHNELLFQSLGETAMVVASGAAQLENGEAPKLEDSLKIGGLPKNSEEDYL